MARERTGVTLIAGFLGSGKTTLLNRILTADHGLRIAVLVNDFGEVNVDSELIVSIEGETMSLINGCICCNVREDLTEAMGALLKRDEPPEHIVIEASGVSDPGAIARTFVMMEMASVVRLDGIVTVIDGEAFAELSGQNERLARKQLSVADVVLLNKADVAQPEQLTALRGEIAERVPRARVIECVEADAPLELVLGAGQFDPARLAERDEDVHVHGADTPEHEHADHSTVFDTWTYRTARPLDTAELRHAAAMLPAGVFRAKGIAYLAERPDRPAVLHVTGKRARLSFLESWKGRRRGTEIVFIGAPGSVDSGDLQQRLDACTVTGLRAAMVPLGPVIEWVRERMYV